MAACVAVYGLSPIDLIPDFIPILGYLDDLIIVPLGIWLAIRLIPPVLLAEHRQAAMARHQPALEIAARLAQENDGEVTLLHVVEVIAEMWAAEDREFYTRLEQTARDHLARLGHYFEERGVPRREEVVFGHRAPCRIPQHTISDVGLLGRAQGPLPGDVSLAQHGMLFWDERPACRRRCLEVLRHPLEKRITKIQSSARH